MSELEKDLKDITFLVLRLFQAMLTKSSLELGLASFEMTTGTGVSYL